MSMGFGFRYSESRAHPTTKVSFAEGLLFSHNAHKNIEGIRQAKGMSH